MLTANEVENKLKEIKPFLESQFQVQKIGYFGSFAKDQQTETSDIDLLVEFAITPGWEFFRLEEYLETVFQRKVDLVTRTALHNQLKEQILSQVKYVE